MLPRLTHVAGHRLLRLLGQGDAAEVYEVLTPEGERRALKLLKANGAPRVQHEARLGQEGEAIAMIEHVNVVRFHDAGVEQGRVWLLLELVDGPDLRVLAQRTGGALPLLRALRILRQACEGVAAAHALGILHRDLKPENILVAEGDLAKVADFGSAKLAGWGVKTTSAQELSSSLYMAPEYMLQRVAIPESDVYAMALVLYELVTGAHPIGTRAPTAIHICQLQMSFDPPPLASLGRDLPGDLSELVQRALSKDPARRPSMRAFADALVVVMRHLQAPQRAVARGLPLPNRELGLARTEPVMRAIGASGTMPMAAFPSVPAPAPDPEPDRSALLPPDPVEGPRSSSMPGAPASLPGGVMTLRSAISSVPARRSGSESHPGAAGWRASTTAPVERAGSGSRPGRAARAGVLALAIVAVLGAAGTVIAVISGQRAALDAGHAAAGGVASGVSGVVPPGVSAVASAPSVAASPRGSASAPAAKVPPSKR